MINSVFIYIPSIADQNSIDPCVTQLVKVSSEPSSGHPNIPMRCQVSSLDGKVLGNVLVRNLIPDSPSVRNFYLKSK
jgi:hypothetical protein